EYKYVTADKQKLAKQKLQIDPAHKVMLVTGGGLGAKILNETMIHIVQEVLGAYEELTILHVTGYKHETDVKNAYDRLKLGEARGRIIVEPYVSDLHVYSAAADIIVARAGATN